MKFCTLSEINEQIHKDSAGFVARCEDDLHRRFYACAEDVRRHMAERPVLLVAGPSGAGKRILMRRLALMLEGMGVRIRLLSLRDYYTSVDPTSAILDPYALTDYDSLECVNGELLREQIRTMAACMPVELPRFHFSSTANETSAEAFIRKPDELVVIYGAHVLNPALLGDCMECTARLYVSLRTRIVDGDAHLHPSVIRFARQWIRDRRTRGRDMVELCDLFPVAVNSENRYIIPYKHTAHYELDTTLLYELGVYRHVMLEDICEFADRPEALPEITLLKDFLCKICPVDVSLVPEHSIIYDLIGGMVDE